MQSSYSEQKSNSDSIKKIAINELNAISETSVSDQATDNLIDLSELIAEIDEILIFIYML